MSVKQLRLFFPKLFYLLRSSPCRIFQSIKDTELIIRHFILLNKLIDQNWVLLGFSTQIKRYWAQNIQICFK